MDFYLSSAVFGKGVGDVRGGGDVDVVYPLEHSISTNLLIELTQGTDSYSLYLSASNGVLPDRKRDYDD